jgi:RimJ/RimL family protein N-acetyltransferase
VPKAPPPTDPGRTVRLRDGTAMRLRPIRPDDAGALIALYDRLSPESAYQRFFTVMRRLPPDWARTLANVDHDRRAAIVAVGPDGELVGVARYGWDAGSDDAEIALVVQDAWQGRGLGAILLTALLTHANRRGITRFRAYVLADNHRMLRLIGELGLVAERSLDQGVVSLRFTRRPDRESRPAGPAPDVGR